MPRQEIKVRWERTVKQAKAWEYLTDSTTEELIFGGGAGGGKTRLGCTWLIIVCGMYPRSRWVMGRAKLKRLKETTLVTFFDVCREWGIEKDVHYRYNEINGTIIWKNGSLILLKDLDFAPSDPDYDDLGSLEITGGFVDEVNQIRFKAWDTLISRCRYKIDEYGIIGKLLGTCNPSKGWVYTEFYRPWKKETLKASRKFVQALLGDNPFASPKYRENLLKRSKPIRERLLKGNWEYDDDPGTLFAYDALNDLFLNKTKAREGEEMVKWITADVSRKGVDQFPVMYWEDFQVKEIVVLPPEIRQSVKKASEWLISYAEKKGVRRSHIIVDEDGVGGGVVDTVECTGFINGSKAVQPDEAKDDPTKKVSYANLKAQCYDLLSKMVESGTMGIDDPDDPDIKNKIVQELELIKQVDIDKDAAFRVTSKEEIKEELGRSPDYADSLMMRMYGEIKPKVYEPGFREI
jgi:hypothetical protein